MTWCFMALAISSCCIDEQSRGLSTALSQQASSLFSLCATVHGKCKENTSTVASQLASSQISLCTIVHDNVRKEGHTICIIGWGITMQGKRDTPLALLAGA